MPRPAITARSEDGQVLFLGTLPKGVTFPHLPGALCALPSQDPETWFPANGDRAGAQKAKAVCFACPARRRCLSWGLKYETTGVWGGSTPLERARLRREAKAARRQETKVSAA